MRTVVMLVGELSSSELGETLFLGTEPAGVLVKVEHLTDAAGSWTTVLVRSGGRIRQESFVADQQITIGVGP